MKNFLNTILKLVAYIIISPLLVPIAIFWTIVWIIDGQPDRLDFLSVIGW